MGWLILPGPTGSCIESTGPLWESGGTGARSISPLYPLPSNPTLWAQSKLVPTCQSKYFCLSLISPLPVITLFVKKTIKHVIHFFKCQLKFDQSKLLPCSLKNKHEIHFLNFSTNGQQRIIKNGSSFDINSDLSHFHLLPSQLPDLGRKTGFFKTIFELWFIICLFFSVKAKFTHPNSTSALRYIFDRSFLRYIADTTELGMLNSLGQIPRWS